MNSKWLWIGFAVAALGGIVWVLLLMLFGNAHDQLYDSLEVEAKMKLSYICELETSHKEKTGTYSKNMEEMGYFQGENDGSRFFYEIGLADSLGFVARAFATKDYDQDEVRMIYEVNETCEIKLIQAD
jgi:hypothetical protein